MKSDPVLLLLSVVVALVVAGLLFRIFHDSDDFWLGIRIRIELVKAEFLIWCIESNSPLAWLSKKMLLYGGMFVSSKVRAKVRLMKEKKAIETLAKEGNDND